MLTKAIEACCEDPGVQADFAQKVRAIEFVPAVGNQGNNSKSLSFQGDSLMYHMVPEMGAAGVHSRKELAEWFEGESKQPCQSFDSTCVCSARQYVVPVVACRGGACDARETAHGRAECMLERKRDSIRGSNYI